MARAAAPPPAEPIRLCLDVNVFVADALSRRSGRAAGASSRIVDLVRARRCPLGPLQLVISSRMLTTLRDVLVRLGIRVADASALIELLDVVAQSGPGAAGPLVLLGGTGLLAMRDAEDAAVAETALAGGAELLITYDLRDFERGPRSRLRTERIASLSGNRPVAVLISHLATGTLVAAVPGLAIGWLLGQTAPPPGILDRFVLPSHDAPR